MSPTAKRLLLFPLKALALLFVGAMAVIQLPELRYDLGGREPVVVARPEELTAERFPRSTFVRVHGTPDFEHAFSYPRYGLDHTYFHVEPFGERLVVRTYERVTEEWEGLDRFLGRLRPFDRQPFSYRIREIYEERLGVEIPDDAFFLALDDVPRPSGWQIGAVVFSAALWCLLFWLFFVHRPKGRGEAVAPPPEALTLGPETVEGPDGSPV